MKKAQLSGSLRANVGKKDAKAIRVAERVPCVLYGSGEQTYFSVRSIDVEKIIFSPDVYQVELDIDGTKKRAIVQDKQIHPLTDKPVHVDFLELVDNKNIKVGIPIRITGRARGVINGGKMYTVFRTMKVEGLPNDVPAEVEIDVTNLRIGQSIRVRDVKVPGVKLLNDENAVIVSIKMARGAVADSHDEAESSEEAPAATEAPAEGAAE
ncbi:MAG: 50S ribosomal protein L25 [Brumimicrobium sp.]|nr:50S ribosomal protein L25 [Brumimicrobium sp.]MCO5267759.1 50S ribosomal protein L25 [Brumimicrobium sp.]